MVRTFVAAAAVAVASFGAHAALVYNTNVTNNVIFGSGNSNGGFTVDTANNVEVGIRAKKRYPSPSDSAANIGFIGIGSGGQGQYQQAAGGFTSGGAPGGSRAAWNFDWSVNTFTVPVNSYSYVLSIDYDPSFGTNFKQFDPINVPCADHSFGSSATAANAGVEVTGKPTAPNAGSGKCSGANLAADTLEYATLVANNSLVQNSWNLDFFDDALFTFNPNTNGNYFIALEVFDAQDQRVAGSLIEVIVGTGFVPEPGSLALVGVALGGLAVARRRKAPR